MATIAIDDVVWPIRWTMVRTQDVIGVEAWRIVILDIVAGSVVVNWRARAPLRPRLHLQPSRRPKRAPRENQNLIGSVTMCCTTKT